MNSNGYSKIEKKPSSARSKSVDFAGQSIPHHKPRSTSSFSTSSRFEYREITKSDGAQKMTTVHHSIPEHETEDCHGEVFGIILGRKCCISAGHPDEAEGDDRQVERSASVFEGYSIIHKSGMNGELDYEDQHGCGFITNRRSHGKKKGKFLGAFRKFFGF